MKKRMIIVTAMIMGTLGAECVSVQASDTLPELTKDNALEQMMKAGETDSLVSNHKSYEATCEYILQNTKVYDYEDSEVMYVDMYGTTQMLYKDGELKYGKEGDEYLSCLYIDEADGNADDLISFYTDETIEEEGVPADLESAEIIVAGGKGLGSAQGFQMLQNLADALGGAVGATRGAVEEGWISHAFQIGQTGKTVSPKLYIACGISGAIQHMVGMSSANMIIAINQDREAPIFQIADYGIVGDIYKIIPEFTKKIVDIV